MDGRRLTGPTTIDGNSVLQRAGAASEADAKDAVATLSGLSDAQRSDRFVRLIATRVLASCESRGVDTAALREALA